MEFAGALTLDEFALWLTQHHPSDQGMSISGDLMAEAAERRITIVVAGSDGRPAVRIGPVEMAEHQLSLQQSNLAVPEAARVITKDFFRRLPRPPLL
jgi:hypothetical protein